MKKKIIIIGFATLFCTTIFGLYSVLPTNDYMRMTFSEKLNCGYSSTILVNGDSIGGETKDGEWCVKLIDLIEKDKNVNVKVNNISKAGNGSFAGIVSWGTMSSVEQRLSDLVILCYGQNDTDDTSFEINYEALIRNTIAGNPNAEIIAVLESSQREYTSKIKSIIELCDYYGIPYVDTIKAFNNSGISYEELTEDGVHPNAVGKEIYARAIYDVIKTQFLEKKHLLDFKGERVKRKKPLNIEADKYSNCCYIPLKNMNVENNVVSVEIPKSSIIGIDLSFTKGDHGIVLTLEGDSEKHYVGYSWNYDIEQRHIYQILDDNHDNVNAEFTFKDENDIQKFNGIVYFEQ